MIQVQPATDLLVKRALERASRALQHKQMRAACAALAPVFAIEPLHSEALALLDTICAQSTSLQSIAPNGDVPLRALRCALIARDGHQEHAIGELLELYESSPDLPYLPWVAQWLRDLPDEKLPLQALYAYLANLMRLFPNIVRFHETERHILKRSFVVLDVLETRLANNALFCILASGVARKAGDKERALRFAHLGLEQETTYDTLITMANAHRMRGEWDKALHYLEQSGQQDAKAAAGVLARDRALVLAEAGRYKEALKAHQTLLARDNSWADLQLSQRYLEWKLGRALPPNFQAFVQSLPPHTTIRAFTERAVEPYVGWLSEPWDATINAVRELDPKQAQPNGEIGPLQMCSSDFEVPSVWLALDLHGDGIRGSVQALEDSEESALRISGGGLRLWNYRYKRAEDQTYWLEECSPALSAPSSQAQTLVGSLAKSPYYAEDWWAQAKQLATEVTDPHEILAVMVHPPARAANHSGWSWLIHVQQAAAFVIAHCPGGVEILGQVALGVPDWTVRAAIVALWRCALQRPEILAQVRGLFGELGQQRHSAIRSYEYALYHCALGLPGWNTQDKKAWQERATKARGEA